MEELRMATRSLGSGTVSFGLVSIPVRLYPAVVSERVSFHLLHAKCGSRIKYQTYCPVCDEVVERDELVKGYEFAKDQYERIREDELEALEGEASSKEIEIAEFVPLATVDPLYLDKAYYLGPDKGAARRYRLLAHVLEKARKVALARFILRGKENLVLIRSVDGGLILHTLYFHDEIRNFREVDRGGPAKVQEAETKLALRLVDELSHEKFEPTHYEDEYRKRVLELVNRRIEGKDVAIAPARAPRGKVIDLMDALRQSLDARGSRKGLAKASPREEADRRQPKRARGGKG
jgi:DNA end-binding protein Ku